MRLRLQMARMKMDCNPYFSKFIALLLGKPIKTQIIVVSLFENSLDIVLLVFHKHFMSD